jgi:hypothetical protein
LGNPPPPKAYRTCGTLGYPSVWLARLPRARRHDAAEDQKRGDVHALGES